MSNKLTPKQEGFCQDFLVLQDKTEAYKKNYNCAKMKPATINRKAVEVSEHPAVMARIAELMEARMERTRVDADYVLNRLTEIDRMDFADILNDDFSFKPISKWPKIWRQFITGLDLAELYEGRGDDRKIAGVLKKIKWPDKVRNLELIGKHVNVQAFKDKLDVEVGAKKSLQELLKEVRQDG
ncbi:terminase small subunit [Neptuniibacter halophilus]|uniref:terminase small subunit n=1 Tax=Neptuniibacter halophilus TaxID=651666 RepID=UPI002573595C|nr:terminase small subunit [Neptuniibacter halophilus]